MKHGLYMAALQPEDVSDLEMMKSTSLMHELLLARATLRRLARYLEDGDLDVDKVLAIVPAMSTMMRTVIRLLNNIDGQGFDWDVVLDDLNKDWGIEI